ncbi:NAD(P)/FAD-dependent oxidoreductase [Terrarubrum flagellatum]|uniref:FAD/NAD(P)-dependent oxidoreductase n=1 Tax=Terrirubrum flagellatum TaxID=2895980 RepID=UPI0031457008
MSERFTSASDLRRSYDLVIVGAGPAGLAAAATASGFGLSVLLADENGAPGGQIYRGITRSSEADRRRLGPDYAAGKKLSAAFAESAAAYTLGALVWSVAPTDEETPDADYPLEVGISLGGVARAIGAQRVLLATGAIERPFPIPGWTLPGVMSAGAAQILLKTSALAPSGRTVIAGSGPLLYLLASQLIAAGAPPVALVDTTPRKNWRVALPDFPAFAMSSYAAKGLKLLFDVAKRIRVIRNVSALEAVGGDKFETLIVTRTNGTMERIDADLLLLHQGVAPNLNLSSAAGCALEWDEKQALFRPKRDEWLESSEAGISIAGDGGGIVGAQASVIEGEIAGLVAAFRLSRISKEMFAQRGAELKKRLASVLRGRAFLDRLFRPADEFRVPQRDDAIVCRCEEVSAGRVRATAALGVQGPNQMKAFLRCGMGPCQGRLCGLTVSEMIAQARGVSPADVGYYRLRPPVKPVPLREFAAMPQSDAAITAVAGFVERSVEKGSAAGSLEPDNRIVER